MAKKKIVSRPGLFGTVYYYDENGKSLGKSRPGLIGGTRVYTDRNGRYAGKSRPGFLAKEVFADTEHNRITSYESLCGDVHFKNGAPAGSTRPGFFDTSYTALETEDAASNEETLDDGDGVEYLPEDSQRVVVRNIQLFALCLVICLVIAVIYAIIN